MAFTSESIVLSLSRFFVVTLSILLIVTISIDTFQNRSFIADRQYLNLQFYICIFFILDVILEWCLSSNKRKYVYSHLFFMLISIPYLNIITWFKIGIPCETEYILRFVPLIRAAYVLAIITKVLSNDKISNMMTAYLIMLLSTVYFSGLLFFIEEHYINPDINSLWSALWWAFMDVTTVGCNINAITPTGKILAVILSAKGLVLFPVFTIYVTNAVTKRKMTHT